MIVLARMLARLVGFALAALATVAGVAAAVFCIAGGRGTLSLASLAADIDLPRVRHIVHRFIEQVTAHGGVAILAGLGALVAVALGLLLLTGTWISPRPRRIVLERSDEGSLGALRRPLARTVAARAVQPDEVDRARVRARARRRRDGGRVRVSVRAALPADRRQARSAARGSVTELTGPLTLRLRMKARGAGRRRRRAQDRRAQEVQA